MKKNIYLVLTVCLIFNFSSASTTTYERTADNLQIASKIEVTSSNKSIILKTPKVDESEKVYDFSNLLTDSEEKSLYEDITAFISNYDMDMVVVTIDDNNKRSAREYADDFYDYNYFGVGNTHDGLIFLIDMDTREMWISTTGEAQRVYDDARIGNILDKTFAKISNQKYYECAQAFIKESDYYASRGVPGSNKNTYIDDEGNYVVGIDDYDEPIAHDSAYYFSLLESLPYLPIAGFSFAISGIIILIAKSKHKMIRKGTNAGSYLVDSSVNITDKEDRFLNTHTSSVRIASSSSYSGGSSSSHHSSSGRSHGGGGRRF